MRRLRGRCLVLALTSRDCNGPLRLFVRRLTEESLSVHCTRPRQRPFAPGASGRSNRAREACSTSSCTRSRLPGVVGQQGDLDAIVELELLEHARDVCLDGRDAHVELAADLGVRLTLPDRDGDLALAFGEAVELLASVALAVASLAVPHVADQPAGDGGREHRLAGGEG